MHPAGSFGYWAANWLWGVPLVAASVVFHAAGLSAIAWLVRRVVGRWGDGPGPLTGEVAFATVTGIATVLLALLHGIEAALWAVVYVGVGAVPNYPTAVYHSLAMMTTTGSDVAAIDPNWKLLGGVQAIGGWLLFGLSTAFLFAVMQALLPLMPPRGRDRGPDR